MAKLNIRTLNGIRTATQPSGRDVAEAFDDVVAALTKATTSIPQSGPVLPAPTGVGTVQTPTRVIPPPGQPPPNNGLQGVSSFTGDGTVLSNSVSTSSVVATLEAVVPNAFLGGPEFGSSAELPTYRYLETPDLPLGGTWDFLGIFSGNFDITGNFSVLGELLDSLGRAGSAGQILSSTGTGVLWAAAGSSTTQTYVVGSGAGLITVGMAVMFDTDGSNTFVYPADLGLESGAPFAGVATTSGADGQTITVQISGSANVFTANSTEPSQYMTALNGGNGTVTTWQYSGSIPNGPGLGNYILGVTVGARNNVTGLQPIVITPFLIPSVGNITKTFSTNGTGNNSLQLDFADLGTSINYLVLCTGGSSGITRSLPPANLNSGCILVTIFKVDAGAGAITITPYPGDTIMGASSYSTGTTQYSYFILENDGINTWYVVGASAVISGTVSTVGAGNLSPLFTTSVTNPTTTPDILFSLDSVAPNAFFCGPEFGSSSALPTFRYIETPDLPTGGTWDFSGIFSGNATFSGPTEFTGEILDHTGSPGTSGQVLSSTGSQVLWETISSAWSALTNASGNLTLANAAFTTTFNQTSAVAWLWANTTTGTNVTTNASPLHEFAANYYTGSTSAQDLWTIGSSLAAGTNGASSLNITHSGSTGAARIIAPNTEAVYGWAGGTGGFGPAASGANIPAAYVSGVESYRFAANSLQTATSVGLDIAGGVGVVGKFSVAPTNGTVSRYLNVATTKNGVAPILNTSIKTLQSAALSASSLVTSTPAAGMWRISFVATITTAASAAGVLGGATGFTITYVNGNGDTVTKTTALSTPIGVGASNSTGDSASGDLYCYSGSATAITFSYGYTAGTGTPMQYDIAVYAEFLG